MICPVCGKKFSFFGSHEGVYCSHACAEAAVKELEELLENMTKEEDDDSDGDTSLREYKE